MYDLDEIGKKKLLIFDMDGTLFDTSESNYQAYRDAALQLGYEIDREHFLKVFVGKNYKEFLPLFSITDPNDLALIHEYKKTHYREYFCQIKKNEVLFSLIRELGKDKKIALATTASRRNTIEILDYFSVTRYFDCIVTQEDVKKLKPDPECYIKVMEKMNISSKDSVIFEDSEVGIRAAEAAESCCIRVNDFQ